MKLHLGCGTIYLKDYINIDAAPHYFADEAPSDILEQNITTIDKYYKHEFCKGSGVCIADQKALIENLGSLYENVDEIVLLHVLEHFPVYKTHEVLSVFYNLLKPNGKLYLAVPDLKETAKLLAAAETPEQEDWAIRLIHGTQRNEFSHHYCGYTERTLKQLLSNHGFGDFIILPNINFYPAVHIEAFKEQI